MMPRYECCTCGKLSDNKKDFYDVCANVGSAKICKTCAAELGYHNFFSVGVHSNTGLLRKYVKLHPEASDRLNHHMLQIGKRNQEIKKELGQMKDNLTKHTGCKKEAQTKCHCKSCGFDYYYSDMDIMKNAANIFKGNIYTLNQVKDFNQCPKCGSRATEKKKVYFWIDQNHNCVDIEE